ncbi:magnesium and cobalt transport protein CorA [Pedobacter psychrophilus]|uniref:Magnesium transport protein CorA n=1 Tax=Pedobacter psychrophilus TaxID=1826909 RepID=A0A179DEW3_9SPHI|nr:magnesium/cobalt transporter CorA [Pedobacter psychrophilus]OAQ39605.1 magnesium and cobalt transport protein CorA [Pedobacter psychrophilus]
MKIPLPKISINKINITQRKRKNNPGEVPGNFLIKEASLPSKIFVYAYISNHLEELNTSDIQEAIAFTKKYPDYTSWIDVKGLGSQDVLDFIQKEFDVNSLVMEDIVNTYQRPKNEDYENFIFVISRMLELDNGLHLKNEQISFLLFKNVLISFQEDYDDVLDPVRNRLRKNAKDNIRTLGPSYMLYALMDTVIDHYFNIVNRLGDELEIVEDHLYQKPRRQLMYRIQGVKKLMIAMRRSSWPERDKLNDLLRSTNSLINPKVKVFLRDAYDHSIQVIDLIESMRETTTSLLDLYLSLMSNKMNEVMKTLTIISAIFIPLTFIAGIYGMNFAHQDPVTGVILKNNMPELYSKNGYLYVLGLMLAIAIAQIFYFSRKGWFKE